MVSLFDEREINTIFELSDAYKDCTDCELCHTRTCVVGWDGPERADLMVVGQSPGATEDSCGIPFSGKAGVRLNDVLRLVKIPRGRIHISNAVWCRNTDGRKNLPPTADHIKACNDRLMREIEFVDPSFIVCLGREAMHAVLGIPLTSSVGAARNQGWTTRIIGGKSRMCKVSWHPAYELRHTGAENRKPPMERTYSVNKEMAADWKDIAARVPHLLERD